MTQTVQFDLINECSVLATAFKDSGLRSALVHEHRVKPDDFGDPRHVVAWTAVVEIVKRRLTWTEDLFASTCGKGEWGGWQYLRGILDDYESVPAENLSTHVERLRLDAAKFRFLSEDQPKLAELIMDPSASAGSVVRQLRRTEERFSRLAFPSVKGGKGLIDELRAEMKLQKIVAPVSRGFGFEKIDRALHPGFVPGTISIVAGRPGTGKTSLLANFLCHRIRSGLGTFVCSYEASATEIARATISSEARIPHARLAGVPNFTDSEKASILRVTETLSNRDLLEIEENPFGTMRATKPFEMNDRNVDHFESQVARSRGKDLFVIDVLGILLPDKRPDSISSSVIRLRSIAKTYGVHVMVLHHMSRASASERPTLEGLKGSGGLEEFADLVLALDRPILRCSPGSRRKKRDVVDVYVLKNRKGPAPMIFSYAFDGACYRFFDEEEKDVSLLEKQEDAD